MNNCPYCGSRPRYDYPVEWRCGSVSDVYRSRDCLVKEIGLLKERVADRERERDHANLVSDSALRENKSLAERVKRLEDAADNMIDAVYSVQDWSGTRVGDCAEELEKAKEANP